MTYVIGVTPLQRETTQNIHSPFVRLLCPADVSGYRPISAASTQKTKLDFILAEKTNGKILDFDGSEGNRRVTPL